MWRDEGLRTIAMGKMHDMVLGKWTDMKRKYGREDFRFKTEKEEAGYYASLSRPTRDMPRGAAQLFNFGNKFHGVEEIVTMVHELVERGRQVAEVERLNMCLRT